MKDWLKINRALDIKNLRVEIENIRQLQAVGAYPQTFSYPLVLQLELTGACNLACRHCYNRSGDRDRTAGTRMTPDKWKELARQIVQDGGIFQCILSGGEPLLLGDDLFAIMDILHEDGTSFVVITNGFLLTREKVKRFAKYRYFWFQISIDGATAHEHDAFRGVSGSWERAVRGALETSQHGIPLVIAHSVTPRTLPQLDEMVELAVKLGASNILIGDILPSGRAFSQEGIMLSPDERNAMCAKIAELNKKYRGRIGIERSMDVRSSMDRYSATPNSGGIIRPNGDFRLDCMAPFTIGNVLEQSIKDMWRKKGIDAWQSKEVRDYIASLDDITQHGNLSNHVDEDIRL